MTGFAPEILWFKSAAFAADPSLASVATEMLKKDDTVVKQYSGQQVDDPSIFLNITIWKATEHHAAWVQANPSITSEVLAAMDGPPSVSDIILSPDEVVAFESAVASPVTQFSEITLKAGSDAAKAEVLLKELHEFGKTRRRSSGAGIAMAKSAGDVDQWFFIVGWESVQAHNDEVTGPKMAGRPTELVTELKSLVDFDVKYANLKLSFDK